MKNIKHGDKSIILKVLFHTNNLESPKLAWTTGKVYIKTNKSRGIRVKPDPKIFNSIEEITSALMKELKEHEIVLVEDKKGQKIIVDKSNYIKSFHKKNKT
jgi:hypothetical protein